MPLRPIAKTRPRPVPPPPATAYVPAPAPVPTPTPPLRPSADGAPAWVTICVSTYPNHLERLDALVAELKRRGHRKASRSGVIRLAVELLNINTVPRALW
jgi:cell division septation protein DedD